MVLLSAHGLPPAQIAALLDCHPATVRRWISRFNREGAAGLADRPRCGRPQLGGCQLTGRIAGLLSRPGPWTLPRIRRYLGWPQVSARTLYRRVRLVAIWRRPKLTARGDPDHDHVVAAIVTRLIDLPRGRRPARKAAGLTAHQTRRADPVDPCSRVEGPRTAGAWSPPARPCRRARRCRAGDRPGMSTCPLSWRRAAGPSVAVGYGFGRTPSCCRRPRMSLSDHFSAILPFSMR
jgi:winged helix-turn helix protein